MIVDISKEDAPFVLAAANATLRTLPDDFRAHREAVSNAMVWLGDYADHDGLDDTVIDSLAGQAIAIVLHARARALARRKAAAEAEEGNGI